MIYAIELLSNMTSERWDEVIQTPESARKSLDGTKVVVKFHTKPSWVSSDTHSKEEMWDVLDTDEWREDLDA